MFQFFSNAIEIIEFDIEIKLGIQTVQKQHVQLPSMVVQTHCQQLVTQIANEKQPMQIIFTTKELMDMSKYGKPDEYAINKLVFSNNLYISAFPQEFKED